MNSEALALCGFVCSFGCLVFNTLQSVHGYGHGYDYGHYYDTIISDIELVRSERKRKLLEVVNSNYIALKELNNHVMVLREHI